MFFFFFLARVRAVYISECVTKMTDQILILGHTSTSYAESSIGGEFVTLCTDENATAVKWSVLLTHFAVSRL